MQNSAKNALFLPMGSPWQKASYQNNLPTFSTNKEEAAYLIKEDPAIWHKGLAHIGQRALTKLSIAVEGCQFSTETEISTDLYDICVQAKLPANINRVPATPMEIYLEKAHSDLCGSLNTATSSSY